MTYTLITGSTSGIGLELAKVFARNGHNLILHGRNSTKLEKVQEDISKKYKKVDIRVIGADLSISEAAKKIYDFTQKEKLKVDILVNNAGFGDLGEFHESDLEKMSSMVTVNITTLMELTHYFTKDMVKAKTGRILNLASVAAFMPGPLMSVYYASKAFVLHFSEAIAEELRSHSITVTTLCPGPTKSNFEDSANMTFSKTASTGGIATSKEVAEYGYEELMSGGGVSVHGLKNKLMILPARLLPRGAMASIIKKVQSEER